MADERYNLPYTGATVEQLLAAIANIVVPTKVSDLTTDSGFITNSSLPTKVSDLDNDSGFITNAAVPTKVSELDNDSGFTTASALATETARAQAAEALLATISSLSAEVTRATGAEDAISALVAEILSLVPAQASDENQLADKNFVNSSIGNLTAKLITNNGAPFSSLAQLQAVTGANNNDYAYVTVSESGAQYYDRYKYNGTSWELEYRVNSTVYTAAQWNAINSGITQALVTKLTGLPDGMNRITDTEINEICV